MERMTEDTPENPFAGIQEKWQKQWEKHDIFRVEEDPKKKKFYCLEMYPYPSGSSLHMGHVRNYTIGDALARFKRMQGFNVLYPMGYDAFGLPAENAAIKEGIHPAEYTKKAIEIIKKQQKELGLSYDWSRQLASCDRDYYRWNQWFFLKMLKEGIAYRKEAPINWCPKCQTVLANEQVEQGKCWRCDSEVEIKPLEQWFLKITDYAERLLKDLDKLAGWPERIISMQRNWIGRSPGTEVHFKIEGTEDIIPIFTTRVDTLFGVTFMVYAPEHPKVMELVKGTEYEEPVKRFIKKVVLEDKFTRTAEDTEKEGMFIGKYAINPVNGEKIPIYIGNFVLLEYGAGAVMAVPADDQRDFEFAKKYDIPIKVVISPDAYELNPEKMSRAFTSDGTLVNSGEFDGLPNRMAIEDIQGYLGKNGLGKRTVQYKIRDWLISRQRYWGTPIPVVYCEKCGMVPVPISDLPVELPTDVKFTGEGNPLLSNEEFLNAKCPACGGTARRETDTMDGFMDSCWYFLGFTTRDRSHQAFDVEKAHYWMPVDQYIGGAEHAVMHLLYARFFTKVLKDMKIVNFDEPFTNLFNQGIVYKDGAKMSKSKGNVVTQEEISERYGIDTARWFLMSLAAPDKTVEWDDNGLAGSNRSLRRIFALLDRKRTEDLDKVAETKMHAAIRDVSQNIEGFKYNLALIDIMSFAKHLEERDEIPSVALKALIQLLAPFCPHVAEEMWEKAGGDGFVSQSRWPQHDVSKIDERVEAGEDLVQETLADMASVKELAGIQDPSKITLYVAELWKYQFIARLKEMLDVTSNPGEIIKELMKDEEMKRHGKEVAKLVPGYVKNRSKLPLVLLSQKDEMDILQGAQVELADEAGTDIEISSDLDHPKAKQAMPGRPAIVVEK